MAETALLALVAFLVTIDPLGLVPIFIALTHGAEPAQRRQMAAKGVLVGGAVLLLFAVLGEKALTTLGIGMAAFRIAGGIVLLIVAIEMVLERRTDRRNTTAGRLMEEHVHEDIAVFPLAIPLIAGPAAITTVILQTSTAGDLGAFAAVLLAMLAVLALVWLVLVLSSALAGALGPTLVMVLSRLLGLMLAALAVQYVIDGIREAFLR
ncbi:MAG TPA: MarC family protein [Geminicoccaceae bacterium]|nr:MarC family protein [Geminicoccaceae bacterium]